MRKASILGFLLVVIMVVLSAFGNKVQKTYTLQFKEAEVNELLYLIENSTAPHNRVRAFQGFLEQQLIPQIDTTKRK